MKNLFFITLLSIQLFIFSNSFAQIVSTSPVNNSLMHNRETSILIKITSPVVESSLSNDKFEINGSFSNDMAFSYKLSVDKKTIILKTDIYFNLEETVTVNINSGLVLENGYSISPEEFSFQIKGKSVPNKAQEEYPKDERISLSTENFPSLTINVNDNPAEGRIFFSNLSALESDNDRFYAVIENDGTPFFAKQDNERGLNFTLQKNGYLTIWDDKGFLMLDSTYTPIKTLKCGNGYYADWHDLQILENGHYFLISYDQQYYNMSEVIEGGRESAIVEGTVIQEFDSEDNLVFQWRSWDHLEITDAINVDFTFSFVFYTHGNAIEIDTDGNILFSVLAMDQILKIDRNTGDIIWYLGGYKNEFTFTNDEGFCIQHDIRRIANGNITLYDNGSCHTPPISRAKEYELDEVNKTATLVWEYEHPKQIHCRAMGNVQRLSNGNTLINWGQLPEFAMTGDDLWPAITEVRPDKTIAYELTFDKFYHFVYRSYRYEWDVAPVNTTVTSPLKSEEFNLSIFPNPSSNYINLLINDETSGDMNINILNTSGILVKQIRNTHIESNMTLKVDISDLSTGVYYCNIILNNNQETKKFVIIR